MNSRAGVAIVGILLSLLPACGKRRSSSTSATAGALPTSAQPDDRAAIAVPVDVVLWNTGSSPVWFRDAKGQRFEVSSHTAAKVAVRRRADGLLAIAACQTDAHSSAVHCSILAPTDDGPLTFVWGSAPAPGDVRFDSEPERIEARQGPAEPAVVEADAVLQRMFNALRADGLQRPPTWAETLVGTTSGGLTVGDAGVMAVYTPKSAVMVNGAGMSFKWIKPGSFVRGTVGRGNTPRGITLTRGFWMGITEVTRAQYAVVSGQALPDATSCDLPQGDLAWNDAQAWLATLSGKGWGVYRLPTEAEWEYVCQAGMLRAFGAALQPNELGWFAQGEWGSTRTVATLKPNDWGIFDMHGNVREWCVDWFSFDPPSGNDPIGPKSGEERVRRGGAFDTPPEDGTCGCRDSDDPTTAARGYGMRAVREPDAVEAIHP